MGNHSEGPWEADKWQVKGKSGDVVAICAPCWLSSEGEANVRLVASAPALVEALRKIAAIEDEMTGGDWEEIEAARLIARDAVYLATGEEIEP